MIMDIFLSFLAWILNGLADILPNWSIPISFLQSWYDTLDNISIFNSFVPVNHFVLAFVLIFIFEITILSAKGAYGIASLFRGGGNIDIK